MNQHQNGVQFPSILDQRVIFREKEFADKLTGFLETANIKGADAAVYVELTNVIHAIGRGEFIVIRDEQVQAVRNMENYQTELLTKLAGYEEALSDSTVALAFDRWRRRNEPPTVAAAEDVEYVEVAAAPGEVEDVP